MNLCRFKTNVLNAHERRLLFDPSSNTVIVQERRLLFDPSSNTVIVQAVDQLQ